MGSLRGRIPETSPAERLRYTAIKGIHIDVDAAQAEPSLITHLGPSLPYLVDPSRLTVGASALCS